jgi:hypothetical protein
MFVLYDASGEADMRLIIDVLRRVKPFTRAEHEEICVGGVIWTVHNLQ